MDLCLSEWSVEHWGVAGTWFSGLATVGIGWVALYLANRREPLRLEIPSFEPFDSEGEWHFRVVNRGRMPITLTVVDWWVGTSGNSFPADLFQATQLPAELQPGRTIWLCVRLPNMAASREEVASMQLAVYASSGIHRKFPIDPRMLEALQRLRGEQS